MLRRRLAMLLLGLSLPLLLISCASPMASSAPMAPNPIDCQGALEKPITWSAKDTDATILAVKEHNAAWVAECGGGIASGPAAEGK